MKKLLFLTVLITISNLTFSQSSDHLQSFDWMVKTFEENDAGFSYIVNKKGADYYKTNTARYREDISQAKTENEFLTLMNEWLHFFRKGHIGFYPNESQPQPSVLSKSAKDSIRQFYKNEEQINLTQKQFENYLHKNKQQINPIEGIWTSGNYTIGIIRSKQKNTSNQFDAFIIKADSLFWMPKQKKAEFIQLPDNTFDVSYSMQNHSKEKATAKWIGKSSGIIEMMNSLWLKTYPGDVGLSLNDSLFLELTTSKKPFLRELSDKTVYLRIPSFVYPEKASIDKLLAENDTKLRSTENLIIDIRNGTGGSDYSYYNLIPYFYTQPIRRIGMKYRATELNAQAFEGYARQLEDTATVNYLMQLANQLRQHTDAYYETGEGVYIDSSYTTSQFPAKIAVVCNKNNGSTDEAFLYDVRQSFKVKIFGRPTGGMIDFSNMNYINSPDGKYQLGYTMTASERLPDYAIDGVGVQPDVFIDQTIEEKDWIEFVKTTLEL